MNGWVLIATAAIATYALRALPLLVFRRLKLRGDGRVVRFLNYAAAGVMGGIIYGALFSGHDAADPATALTGPMVALKLAVVLLSATLALWRRNVMAPLLACTALAAAGLLLMGT